MADAHKHDARWNNARDRLRLYGLDDVVHATIVLDSDDVAHWTCHHCPHHGHQPSYSDAWSVFLDHERHVHPEISR